MASNVTRAMIFRIVIPTQCYEETVIFYRDVLGFNLLNEKDGLGFLKSSISSELVLTVQSIAADSDYAPTGHGMFLRYLIPRLETLKQRLLEHGMSWTETPNGIANSVLIHDPNNNVVLVEAIASGNAALPQTGRATDQAEIELSFIASEAREMAYAASQLVEQLRHHGTPDMLVEPIRQIRLGLAACRRGNLSPCLWVF